VEVAVLHVGGEIEIVLVPEQPGLRRRFRLALLPVDAEVPNFLGIFPGRLVGLAVDRDRPGGPAALGGACDGRIVRLLLLCGGLALDAAGQCEQRGKTQSYAHLKSSVRSTLLAGSHSRARHERETVSKPYEAIHHPAGGERPSAALAGPGKSPAPAR